jgi:hypothetical protein
VSPVFGLIALERIVAVDADAAHAFEAAADLQVWVEGLGHTHAEGERWQWHVALMGAPLHGTARRLKHDPPRHTVVMWEGALRARWTVDVSPGVPRGARIAVRFECDQPGALLARASEPAFVETVLAKWLDDSVAFLKSELEQS